MDYLGDLLYWVDCVMPFLDVMGGCCLTGWGYVRVVLWEPHPHTLIEWGPIQSETGSGHFVASYSGFLINF